MTEQLLALLLKQALLLSGGVALLAALRKPLLRLGAGVTYAAWLLVPALLLTAALPRPTQEPLHVALEAAGGASLAMAPPALVTPAPTVAMALLVAWLAGALLLTAVLARRQWQLARLGTHLPAGSSPALVGVLRPRVALPRDFDQRFPPEQRQLILAHEEVHRARHDNAWNLLASALLAVHWWNPLAWWAARRFRADQELACDAAVLATHPGAQADYTQALLAAHDLHHLGAPLASRWGTSHPLIERIAMLDHPRPLPRLGNLALASLLLTATGLAYAAQSATPPADARQMELKLDISYRTGTDKDRKTMSSQPTIRVRTGERATVMFNGTPGAPTPESLAIAIVARDLGDDKIELQTEVSKGSPLTIAYKPRLITHNGVKARIEQGSDNPADMERLSLAITPTFLGEPKP